jgi:hypothetical protein
VSEEGRGERTGRPVPQGALKGGALGQEVDVATRIPILSQATHLLRHEDDVIFGAEDAATVDRVEPGVQLRAAPGPELSEAVGGAGHGEGAGGV